MMFFFHKLFRCWGGLTPPEEAYENPFEPIPVICSVCGQLWECMVEVDCGVPSFGSAFVRWNEQESDTAGDGPEVATIRNEEINLFLDWQESSLACGNKDVR